MAQEAKFELLNYRSNKRGVTWEGGESISFYDYIVKLTDADGEVVRYNITDYYNEEMNEITDTRIWVLTDKVMELELIEDIINYLDKSFSSRKFLPKVQNDIMQIIVDSFDELEWSMNTNGNVELKNK